MSMARRETDGLADDYVPRLLVVDDNADNREVLTRRLRRLGYGSVDNAEDGRAALDLITSQAAAGTPYDAVLLDVMMPRMNGVEVLEALAADEQIAQTPVIMISASTELDTVVRCIELGAEDYLPKPFNPVLLRARLGTVLEKKRLRDEVARQLQRIERELADARRQQLSMVPDAFPMSDAVAVHALMFPAREIGGDLYDCFEVVPGVLCIAVGDVSGKGVPAALFMARARSLLRASTLQHVAAAGIPPRPSELVRVMNEELCKNNPSCMFITLFVGFFEIATGVLRFVNAGHVRPFVMGDGRAVREIATRPLLPLGVMSDVSHADDSEVLEEGDCVVVITDGLPEMTDTGGAFYTLERVVADLAELGDAAPEVITATLCARAASFGAGAPAADDVTVLALRRLAGA
jgi:serine phosphatase RsbU (regulator of sigma subunit)